MKTLIKSVLAILFGLFLASQNSFAWTNYVDSAGSDTAPYDTLAKAAHSIQDAVNYAVEGNVVLVADGTYTVASHIIITTNNIILKSVNGAANTAINGNSTVNGVYLHGTSTIDGFSIINCSTVNGAGIFVWDRGTILNCIFTNNFASQKGGGINAIHCLISNCYFYANGAENGGGISIRAYSFIKDCTFESNFATNGGAVFCFSPNAGGISDSIISNNTASSGGGIYVDSTSSIALTNTMVEYNHAFVSGGGISADSAEVSIAENCYIKDNVAGKMGGGIYADNTIVSITGTNTYLGIFYFWSGANRCTGGDGGGLYAVDSDIVLSGKQCYAGYNYCTRDGAAFYITNSSLSLLDGVQVLAGWGSRSGGGIYAMDSKITMDNSIIQYCGATNGGGIFAISSSGTFNNATISFNNANAGSGGGFCSVLTSDYYFTDSVIANNSAKNGGGIFGYLTAGDFILNNTDVISNKAANAGSLGGGIYWMSMATLEANECRINYNFGDDNVGGVYFFYPAKFLLKNTDISYNAASNFVGGIAVFNGGQVECTDCNIIGNIADLSSNGIGGAGAIYVTSGSSVDLISLNGTSAVTNNSAVNGGAVFLMTGGKLSAYGDVLFADNRVSQNGGAIYATNQGFASLMPTNGASPRMIDNLAQINGGGVAMYSASELTMVNSLFENNLCSNYGGAFFLYGASTGTIYAAFSSSNSVPPSAFIGNRSLIGGAVFIVNASLLNISDSLFISNSAFHAAGTGGAMYLSSTSLLNIENSIIARNSAVASGSGIGISGSAAMQMRQCTVTENNTGGVDGGTIAITNSVFWNNGGVEITAGKAVDYCDVDGGYATGNGNIDADPMFEDSGTLDFRLALGSPCIDTGTVVNIHNDCIGNTRPMGGGFDLGAYELDPAPILNVTPLELDFGDVVVNDSSNLIVSVGNPGNSTLDGTVVNVMIPIFSVQSGSPYSLPPLSSDVVTFSFSPISETVLTNIVTFQSDGGNLNVTLIGNGVPEPCYLLFIICQLLLINYWRKF